MCIYHLTEAAKPQFDHAAVAAAAAGAAQQAVGYVNRLFPGSALYLSQPTEFSSAADADTKSRGTAPSANKVRTRGRFRVDLPYLTAHFESELGRRCTYISVAAVLYASMRLQLLPQCVTHPAAYLVLEQGFAELLRSLRGRARLRDVYDGLHAVGTTADALHSALQLGVPLPPEAARLGLQVLECVAAATKVGLPLLSIQAAQQAKLLAAVEEVATGRAVDTPR